jgi:hypothetical protein
MAYYPAVRDPGSIDLLLNLVRQTPPPPVIDLDYLRDAGFRRDGDNALVDLLVFLGLTDADGKPASMWMAYAADRTGRLLADSVRKSYARLYESFPDPEARDADELMPFFKKMTGAPDTDLAFMILTFRVLRDIAGPSLPPAPAPPDAQPSRPARTQIQPLQPIMPANPGGPGFERGTGLRVEHAGGMKLRITIEVDAAGDAELSALVRALLAKAIRSQDQKGISS